VLVVKILIQLLIQIKQKKQKKNTNINKFRIFTSSVLKRNTSENNKIIKSKSRNKILNDRLYLDIVKFMCNNPVFLE
jgi:hypothetical protein